MYIAINSCMEVSDAIWLSLAFVAVHPPFAAHELLYSNCCEIVIIGESAV